MPLPLVSVEILRTLCFSMFQLCLGRKAVERNENSTASKVYTEGLSCPEIHHVERVQLAGAGREGPSIPPNRVEIISSRGQERLQCGLTHGFAGGGLPLRSETG